MWLPDQAWLRGNIHAASGVAAIAAQIFEHCDPIGSRTDSAPKQWCNLMSIPNPKSALVLFAHGSRDPKWAEPFEAIQALIRAQAPDTLVELAFLELMQPGIQECLGVLAKQGVKRVSVVPIFLAAGRHLREDLPALIAPVQQQFPDLEIIVSTPIGDIPEFQEAIAKLALAQAKL